MTNSIEKVIINYLTEKLSEPVYGERPEEAPDSFVVVQKTAGGLRDCIETATLAIQSHAKSLLETIDLNEAVKVAMIGAPYYTAEVFNVALNSDYNFTDTSRKEHRYQAVFNVSYHL